MVDQQKELKNIVYLPFCKTVSVSFYGRAFILYGSLYLLALWIDDSTSIWTPYLLSCSKIILLLDKKFPFICKKNTSCNLETCSRQTAFHPYYFWYFQFWIFYFEITNHSSAWNPSRSHIRTTSKALPSHDTTRKALPLRPYSGPAPVDTEFARRKTQAAFRLSNQTFPRPEHTNSGGCHAASWKKRFWWTQR